MAVVDRDKLKKVTDFSRYTTRVRASAIGPAWVLLVDIINVFKRHRTPMLARQAAYSLLYAVPSAFVLIVALANLIDRRIGSRLSDTLVDLINTSAPVETRAILEEFVLHALVETSANQATVAAGLSISVAVWGGAGGMGALILACNVVYDVLDRRNFFIKQAMRLIMTIVQGLVFLVSLALFSVGHRIAEWLQTEHAVDSRLVSMMSSGRMLATALIFSSLFLLYSIAPDVEKQYRWLLPGTALATAALIGLLALVDTLLRFFDPSGAYGIAGSVLVFLWILYLMSLVVICGAVVNAAVGARYDAKLRGYLEENPSRRIYGRPWTDEPPLIA